ncbi:MAG: hypothetical protein CVT94_03255 [Bacteroidetes bacterium HGW-Bacteroidetes-11]|jgi:hypothetical protein|nr:MAG: hypothetical protein CVT94_03255 [Bacteroidetes bacterium HGW-Bacteroidetes-11]
MKDERNNIDDLFREGLSDLNPPPPPDVWTRVDAALPPSGSAPVSVPMGKRWILTGFGGLLITSIALLWFFNARINTETENVDSPASPRQSAEVSIPTIEEKPVSDNTKSAVNPQKSSPNRIVTESKVQNISQADKSSTAERISHGAVNIKGEEETQTFVAETSANNNASQSTNELELLDLRSDFTNWLSSRTSAEIVAENSPAFDLRYKNSGNPLLPEPTSIPLIGGAYASWDMIYYGNDHRKQSRSAGLSLGTFKGPWEFETGIAYAISDDNGRFDINYSSYDSIGFYNKVVSFSPDLQNPGRILFNTVIEGVYDSIGHNIQTKTSNSYTYLQIPLMAGYRVYANRFLTISLKAGPVFSLMIGSDEQQASFSQENASLQSISDLSPDRVSANWQVAASLGVGLRLSRRFTLLAEPTYKSYLRPVYQNTRTKPQSIGIKTGLLYRF